MPKVGAHSSSRAEAALGRAAASDGRCFYMTQMHHVQSIVCVESSFPSLASKLKGATVAVLLQLGTRFWMFVVKEGWLSHGCDCYILA